MKNLRRQLAPARPVSFRTSGVALWLVFLLATHAFWCGLAGSNCETDIAPESAISAVATRAVAMVAMVVTHSITDTDFCAGVDENMNLPCALAPLVVAPALVWIALVWVVAAPVAPASVLALWQRAAVFDRDGPVCVPPLHGRLVRASLPHRAPPVTLI